MEAYTERCCNLSLKKPPNCALRPENCESDSKNVGCPSGHSLDSKTVGYPTGHRFGQSVKWRKPEPTFTHKVSPLVINSQAPYSRSVFIRLFFGSVDVKKETKLFPHKLQVPAETKNWRITVARSQSQTFASLSSEDRDHGRILRDLTTTM
ncbi:unnamed protein product, partial [Cyprideis torosa]